MSGATGGCEQLLFPVIYGMILVEKGPGQTSATSQTTRQPSCDTNGSINAGGAFEAGHSAEGRRVWTPVHTYFVKV